MNVVAITSLVLIHFAVVQPAASYEVWEETGNMNNGRYDHTATLLQNGLVLVAGGYNGGYLSTCELFDSSSGQWTSTASMTTSRVSHTATLLQNGLVLVAGGSLGSYLSSELFDSSTGRWTATGSMTTIRRDHTATLLENGLVLVAGGYNSSYGYLSSCELFDSSTGQWTATGSMTTTREYHTATLLQNGLVLVAGGSLGSYLSSCELFDSSSGRWTATGSMTTARYDHTATLLQNGLVLVAGGDSGSSLSSCELFDPAPGRWTATGNMTTTRTDHTATLLQNGLVLVIGGNSYLADLNDCELFNSPTGQWISTASMTISRVHNTATLLQNGEVLVAGGYGGSTLSSSELYVPAKVKIAVGIILGSFAGFALVVLALWFIKYRSSIKTPNKDAITTKVTQEELQSLLDPPLKQTTKAARMWKLCFYCCCVAEYVFLAIATTFVYIFLVSKIYFPDDIYDTAKIVMWVFVGLFLIGIGICRTTLALWRRNLSAYSGILKLHGCHVDKLKNFLLLNQNGLQQKRSEVNFRVTDEFYGTVGTPDKIVEVLTTFKLNKVKFQVDQGIVTCLSAYGWLPVLLSSDQPIERIQAILELYITAGYISEASFKQLLVMTAITNNPRPLEALLKAKLTSTIIEKFYFVVEPSPATDLQVFRNGLLLSWICICFGGIPTLISFFPYGEWWERDVEPSPCKILLPSPLIIAASLGHSAALQALLQTRLKIDSQHPKRQTALHFAVQNGHVDAALMLLKAGADPDFENFVNKTPLDVAPNEDVKQQLEQSFLDAREAFKKKALEKTRPKFLPSSSSRPPIQAQPQPVVNVVNPIQGSINQDMPADIIINEQALQVEKQISSGQFGIVYRGKYNFALVAVKATKGITAESREDLLNEARLMRSIPPHPNVVQYLGVCVTPSNLLLVIEWCNKGSLLDYVRKIPLSERTTIYMALQIAAGMMHLSSFIVHRDLALRNVLIVDRGEEGLIAKISDFGLSRPVNDKNYYRLTEANRLLPLAWTPPEVLNRHVHTTESDVWSFGVVMWELFSRGSQPNTDHRKMPPLPQLPSIPDNVFELMMACWNRNAMLRPSFAQVYSSLSFPQQ